LIAALGPKQPSVWATLLRGGDLEEPFLDLAVARSDGFRYFIWQETDRSKFDERVTLVLPATVTLRSSDRRPLKLEDVEDPITGKKVGGISVKTSADGAITVTLPVKDYPFILTLRG
jgi:hypothetical protein